MVCCAKLMSIKYICANFIYISLSLLLFLTYILFGGVAYACTYSPGYSLSVFSVETTYQLL